MILEIDHVQLAMPKGAEEIARHFFTDVLGFEEIDKPEPLRSRGGCWFKKNNAILHLGVEESFSPARKAHPAFRVSDIASFRQRLQDDNIEVTDDNSLQHVRRFFVFDPFGNRIEFIQEGDKY